uniref:WG repeat-containing protein n=2 Tax=unclassified Prevotella TaxID=2638335 RepID=A0AB33JGU4_9BACT
MMKIRIIVSTLCACCIGLIYDKANYYKGRSIIEYKCLPYNFVPSYIELTSNIKGLLKSKRFFCFIYNGYETVGHGFGYVYNKDGLIKDGYKTKNVFSISEIIGYYYDEKRICMICTDEKNRVRCVMPYSYKSDCIFVEVPFPQDRTSLKYVNTVDI